MTEYRLRATGEVLTDTELRRSVNAGLPAILSTDDWDVLGIDPVLAAPVPEITEHQSVARNGAVLDSLGNWVYAYVIEELTTEQIAAYEATKAAEDAEKVANKVQTLWEAADKYTSGYISGVAIGILTIGVIQSKPKALAVSGWSSQVWGEYYTRKALVTVDSIDNYDFSEFGPMPHSVPELQVEVGL